MWTKRQGKFRLWKTEETKLELLKQFDWNGCNGGYRRQQPNAKPHKPIGRWKSGTHLNSNERIFLFFFWNWFSHFDLFLTQKSWEIENKVEILKHLYFCFNTLTGEFIFEWRCYSVCSIRRRWQSYAIVSNIYIESSVGRQNLEKHFGLFADPQPSPIRPKEVISATATLHQSIHWVARQSQFNHRSVARRIH